MIGSIRQPEYTGENRCLPCTAVNVLIAVVAGSLVAAVPVLTDIAATAPSLAAGGAVVVVSLVLIYLRGYLVPGTPTLTKRYLPPSVLRLFGKDPAPPGGPTVAGARERERSDTGVESSAGDDSSADADASATDGSTVDPEALLQAVGALEPCADRDDLCLVEEFRTAWNAEIEAVRDRGTEAASLARALGLATEDCRIRDHGDGRRLTADGAVVGQWPSEAALVADTAAAVLLESRLDGWERLRPAERGQLLSGLRLFLRDCPTGDGGVEFGEETVESCCTSREVVAVTCEETGERLFEQPIRG